MPSALCRFEKNEAGSRQRPEPAAIHCRAGHYTIRKLDKALQGLSWKFASKDLASANPPTLQGIKNIMNVPHDTDAGAPQDDTRFNSRIDDLIRGTLRSHQAAQRSGSARQLRPIDQFGRQTGN